MGWPADHGLSRNRLSSAGLLLNFLCLLGVAKLDQPKAGEDGKVPMTLEPIRFIGEVVEVHFNQPPALEKKPGPPDAFTWREEVFLVAEVLKEWHDYQRRGRMARTMQPRHADRAARKGSWGVGQDYFRVRTQAGRIFDLYYDRAPRGVDRRKGEWVLYRELAPAA